MYVKKFKEIDKYKCCFITTITTLLFYIIIPYLLLINDIIWQHKNDINIQYIANSNIIINRTSTRNILNKHINKFNNSVNHNLIIFDGSYHPIKIPYFSIYLKKDLTNYIKYKNDVRDCDDFSFIMYANIHRLQSRYYKHSLYVGILIGKLKKYDKYGHVVNFIIDDKNLDIICFEPQNDKLMKCYEMFYKVRYLII